MDDVIANITPGRVRRVSKRWNISQRDAFELIVNVETRQSVVPIDSDEETINAIVVNHSFIENNTDTESESEYFSVETDSFIENNKDNEDYSCWDYFLNYFCCCCFLYM